MIHNVVASIGYRLDEYIRNSLSLIDETVIVSSLVDLKGNINPETENKISIFLLNIEEERTAKNGHFQSSAGSNPPVTINLYLMFSAYFPNFNYMESLRYISLVIEFFQSNNSFASSNTPLLSNEIDKIFVEISNVGIEEISRLWSHLGANYVPSVAYKVKHIVFDGNTISENISSISKVQN
mgnify:CR=1 FL=1|jgi:hypothetical protein|tara:strand:+ start:10750 stop:11295 length:546 start_codon:yes stop_codon:yes gene_type:complete